MLAQTAAAVPFALAPALTFPSPPSRLPKPSSPAQTLESLTTIIIGATFAAGLTVSGMTLPSKVAAFLSPLVPAWDPTLAFVMGSALVLGVVAYQVGVNRGSLGQGGKGGTRTLRFLPFMCRQACW